MDADITVTEPTNSYHVNDLNDWMPGTAPGEVPASPLNPVLYSA
jgi:hypothetical protein